MAVCRDLVIVCSNLACSRVQGSCLGRMEAWSLLFNDFLIDISQPPECLVLWRNQYMLSVGIASSRIVENWQNPESFPVRIYGVCVIFRLKGYGSRSRLI